MLNSTKYPGFQGQNRKKMNLIRGILPGMPVRKNGGCRGKGEKDTGRDKNFFRIMEEIFLGFPGKEGKTRTQEGLTIPENRDRIG